MKKDVYSIFDAAVTIWLMTVGLESLDVLPNDFYGNIFSFVDHCAETYPPHNINGNK